MRALNRRVEACSEDQVAAAGEKVVAASRVRRWRG